MNDDAVANRIQIAGAVENVFSVKASLQMNSDIAIAMRDVLNSGMIDFLISNTEAIDEITKFVPGYATMSVEDQLWYEQPYMETVAFINETIDLEYERGDQTGVIKITNTTNRKDRYTSVSYGNYFANLLERDLLTDNSEYEFVPLYN